MVRIIFVDDEPMLLDAMRARLRRHRDAWAMRFVGSGAEALAALELEPADVIVTDARMPEMGGFELLTQARERHPNTLRILLSGQSDQSAVIEGLRLAHQYLCKPCSNDQLVSAVERLLAMQKAFSNPEMQRVINSVERLPSPSAVQCELARALASPDVNLKYIAAIVQRDPALSLRLMRMANSAYLGGVSPVTEVAAAVSRLGIDMVNGLSASTQVLGAVESQLGTHKPLVELMQQRGLEVARAASKLLQGEEASRAYLAGLLHDVGGLVMLSALPEHREALFTGAPWACQRVAVEQKLLGFSHAEVGAYLLGTWGLPLSLVDAVARQHAPPAAPGVLDTVGAVHIAQRLVMEQQSLAKGEAIVAEYDPQYLETSGHDMKALTLQALS